MAKHLIITILAVGLFCISASADESYPPSTVAYQAPAADTVRVAEVNGRGPEAKLENVTILHKQDDLVEHPYFHFPGSEAAIVIDDAPLLNPTDQLTLAVWFNPDAYCGFNPQKPLLVKSCPTHQYPFYQYGLFLYDDHDTGLRTSLILSLDGKLADFSTSRNPLQLLDGWNHLAATFDGRTVVIYLTGQKMVRTWAQSSAFYASTVHS